MTYQNTIANHLREWVAIIRVPGRSSLLMADELLDAADLLDAQAAEIAALKAERDALRGAVFCFRDIVTECRVHWGGDHLWTKWRINDAIADAEAALDKAITTKKDKP